MVADQEAFYYISAERCYIQPNSVTVTSHVTCDLCDIYSTTRGQLLSLH